MPVGIFGGTFDPPHIAHLILAAEAQAQLGLSQVLWVLTAGPPHKQGLPLSDLEHRLGMLEVAIRDNLCFSISRVDIDRPPPHYSLDTVRLLSQACPHEELIYLMGGDSLNDLPTWHQPVQFVAACDGIGVMRRPGEEPTHLTDLEASIPGLSEKVQFIEAPLLEISSSDIRRRAAQGLPFRYFLPPGVYEIIQANHLYQG